MPGTKKKSYSATPSIRLNELAGPLLRRAEEEDTKPAEVIRRALKSYLEAPRIADTAGLLAELRALRTDLARVGNNLNQIAHRFNTQEQADPGPHELETLFADMRRVFWDATQLTKAVIGELEKDK